MPSLRCGFDDDDDSDVYGGDDSVESPTDLLPVASKIVVIVDIAIISLLYFSCRLSSIMV